ncbi:MAG: hypothetical protein ACYC23_23640, partial [Limisphaerales bacterium]
VEPGKIEGPSQWLVAVVRFGDGLASVGLSDEKPGVAKRRRPDLQVPGGPLRLLLMGGPVVGF